VLPGSFHSRFSPYLTLKPLRVRAIEAPRPVLRVRAIRSTTVAYCVTTKV
jgi:hypothetical protein